MSNIGYREVIGLDTLSLKQLNDNLRALWSKVMGDIQLRDLGNDATQLLERKVDSQVLDAYSTIAQTGEAITTAVVDLNLGQYATVVQTADMIETSVGQVDGRLATVEQTANGLTARVTNAEGKVSQVEQTASGLTTRVEGAESKVSRVEQTASGLSSTVSGLNGRVSTLEQTDSSVAVKLKDANNAFEAAISTVSGTIGLAFYNGALIGGITGDAGGMLVDAMGGLDLIGDSLHMQGGSASAWLQDGRMAVRGHVVPEMGGTYSLGTRGATEGEDRWKNVNITGSVDNSSDRRVKRDIADLDADKLLSLLSLLRARQFHMIADGETGKARWGFIAQEVAEALKSLGISDVEFYNDDNPEHLSLCYTELIAVLVEGYQHMCKRLNVLEKTLAKREVVRV